MNTEVIIIIVVAVLVLLAVVAFFVLKKEKFSTTTPRPTLSNLQYTENIINLLVKQLDTSNLSPTDLTSIFNLTITCIMENLIYINIAANSIPGSPQYMSAMQTISDNLYKYNSGTSFYFVAQSLFDLYFSIRLYSNVLSQLNTNANYNKVLTYFPEFPSLLYLQ